MPHDQSPSGRRGRKFAIGTRKLLFGLTEEQVNEEHLQNPRLFYAPADTLLRQTRIHCSCMHGASKNIIVARPTTARQRLTSWA